MDKAEKIGELEKLKRELLSNTALPLREANLVFGEGNIDAQVMFIGEAPGANEDRTGRPFVGRGGQLLDGMIASIGWKREDIYIANIVKRRPPENRDPLPSEIEAYKPYLTRQIHIINPKMIVTLGRFSMNYFLPLAKITRDHGRAMLIDGRIIFPVYHPAAALRATEMKDVLQADFKKIPGILEAGVEKIDIGPAFLETPAKSAKGQKDKPQQPGLF
jgi:uracil-DNA glycosylase family 4